MRKAIYRGEDAEARDLFARADVVRLALVGEDGLPILRTVNAVVVDGAIAFHGAPLGEKMEGIGRPCVVEASETVASIPSYFLDPERACPATTYYLSAHAKGTLEEVTSQDDKARVLSALMAKYQPEGGHAPIDGASPLYAKAIRGLLVAKVSPEDVACKAKLGQNRTPEDRVRVLEALWRRGAPGDVRAAALVLRRFPDLPAPPFLARRAGGGFRLLCDLDGGEIDEAAALLTTPDVYWLAGVPRDVVRDAVLRSTARVAARDARDGRLVAFARAVSDGKVAWIYDVYLAERVRRGGLGRALMDLLMDHPALRGARHVRLTTRDAMRFYERLGFSDLAEAPRYSWRSTEMIKTLPKPWAPASAASPASQNQNEPASPAPPIP